ncbi:MAG: peptidylprolyl isomerase [Gammaproteobacteria bacterium]|nr:MAG: peptidylprolyl isomerase [Gammaproteobacteria bacterium]
MSLQRRLRLNFALSLEDGTEVDSNFGGEPVACVVGDGSLLPSFEACVLGLEPGERKQFTLPPEQAFGEVKDDNRQRVPRARFGDDVPPEPGLVLLFKEASGGDVPGVVIAADEEWVMVDFNHPLAGRTLIFDVQLHAIDELEEA